MSTTKTNTDFEYDYSLGTILLAIVLTFTWPILIVPYIFIKSLIGWGENGPTLDLVERERVQWLYGTGRYAKKD